MFRFDGRCGRKIGSDGVRGLQPITGDANNCGFIATDAALFNQFSSDAGSNSTCGFGEYSFVLGEQFDGVDDFRIGNIFGPASAFADQANGERTVRGISDGQGTRDGVRLLRLEARRFRFTPSAIGEQPVACAPKNFTCLGSTQPRWASSQNAFAILPISEPPAIGTTTLSGNSHPSCSAIS